MMPKEIKEFAKKENTFNYKYVYYKTGNDIRLKGVRVLERDFEKFALTTMRKYGRCSIIDITDKPIKFKNLNQVKGEL